MQGRPTKGTGQIQATSTLSCFFSDIQTLGRGTHLRWEQHCSCDQSLTLLTLVPSNFKFSSHWSHSRIWYSTEWKKTGRDRGTNDHIEVSNRLQEFKTPWQMQKGKETNTCVAFRATVNFLTSDRMIVIGHRQHSTWRESNTVAISAEGDLRQVVRAPPKIPQTPSWFKGKS